MNELRLFKVILFMIIVSVVLIEGRGGRGRGGGSFGSLFGGWRKYKKPASSSSSRRIINGSPMHTSMTKSSPSISSSSSSIKQSAKASHLHGSYPKQPMPLRSYGSQGYNPLGGGYYAPGNPGAAHLPPGSSYYTNTASIPQGAIYYAQPHSSSSSSDLFLGYMTGSMLSNMFNRHHVSHIYHQQSPPAPTPSQGTKVIVINNGEVSNATNTETFLPPGSNVPLAPLNETKSTEESNHPETQTPPNLEMPAKGETTPPETAPPNGIICMPMTLNETDPNNPQRTINVVRIVCFPAPPPPEDFLTTLSPANKENCVSGLFVETDPKDPTKTVEVHKEECMNTTSVPKDIVGEITDISDNEKR